MDQRQELTLQLRESFDRVHALDRICGSRCDGLDADTANRVKGAIKAERDKEIDHIKMLALDLIRLDASGAGETWVTMNGTHVLVGNGGRVVGGPTRLQNYKYRQYYENHTITHGSDKTGAISYSGSKSHISQAVHAQGFDGAPKIVDKKEFNKACKASGFAAQRVYTGTTQDVVDAYQHQFYSGEFYVDCSAGGAQYGQGMYCASDYTGKISAGIKTEMSHYTQLGAQRGNKHAIVESMTLDPSAKTVKFGDIRGEYIAHVTHGLGGKKDAKIDKALDDVRRCAAACDDRPGVMISRGIQASPMKKQALGDAYKRLKTEVRRVYGDAGVKKVNEAIDRAKKASHAAEFGNKGDDVGVLATEMGFDAIRADGHGKSGSYTVVLNRTKLLVLGDPMHKQ